VTAGHAMPEFRKARAQDSTANTLHTSEQVWRHKPLSTVTNPHNTWQHTLVVHTQQAATTPESLLPFFWQLNQQQHTLAAKAR
jgi:hypothetical protein